MRLKYLFFLFFPVLLLIGEKSDAQTPLSGFTPCASYTISVSGTSANQQLSTCGSTAVLWNVGTQELFVALGTGSGTVAVATTGMSVPAGDRIVLNVGNSQLYLAAITSTSSSTLRISQGWGYP